MSAPSDLFTPDKPVPVVRHEVRDAVSGQFTPTPGKLTSTPSRSHKRKKPLVVAGVSGVGAKVASRPEGSSSDDRGKCEKGKGKTTKSSSTSRPTTAKPPVLSRPSPDVLDAWSEDDDPPVLTSETDVLTSAPAAGSIDPVSDHVTAIGGGCYYTFCSGCRFGSGPAWVACPFS